MYGPNYSGLAFHPKTVRMVGPVHLATFFARSAELCRAACFGGAAAASAHIVILCKIAHPAVVCDVRHRFAITAFRIDLPELIPCAAWLMSIEHCHAYSAHCPVQPGAMRPRSRHRVSACCSGTYPPARFTDASPLSQKTKSGVFHVKHAARFPPTAPPIKLFFSPTPGMFRSRADSAPAPPPALPAQTPPSPVHSRSPRSAAQPERSARSEASRRLCRVTR